jgi:TRAP-type mannitol/chloroaromatic compound transport system permease large subunit
MTRRTKLRLVTALQVALVAAVWATLGGAPAATMVVVMGLFELQRRLRIET